MISGIGNTLEEKMLRIATGQRIQRTSQDVAGMAMGTKMKTQQMGYEQEIRNIQDLISCRRVAAGGVESISGNLQRMNQLAIAASSDLLTSEQRGFIQMEVEQLSAEITRMAEATTFNQQQVIPELTAANLGVSGLNVVTAPEVAIGVIEGALETTTSTGAEIGAQEVGFGARLRATRVQLGAITGAYSRIMGTDIARETIWKK